MRSNRPYVQIDPSVIEQARQMDLLSYLQRYEPSTLKRVAGNVYCTKEHEYSCAMKSHFRKFGNQMSGSGNHLCNYASLLA